MSKTSSSGSSFQLVLLRHGESIWNQENRFTGWVDVDLAPQGLFEAQAAGKLLRKEGFTFDVAFTSVLKRAIRTLWTVTDEMDLLWIPVHRTWRLNERHYGALQGLNKSDMAAKYGEDQVKVWRRSFDIPPPPLSAESEMFPSKDPRYQDIPAGEIPVAESLKETIKRVIPYWNEQIVPQIRSGKRVLITAHGNSLRALIKHLKGTSDQDIIGLNMPTGIPYVLELDSNLKVVRDYFLGDQEAIAAKMNAVANQGKK